VKDAAPVPAAAPARIVVGRGLVAAVAGAACVFGFAPFYAWPVPLLALALLFALWRARGTPMQAALVGLGFGLGYFLVGTSWVYVSLHRYGDMPAVLAALATFLFCSYLALHPALAAWIAVRFGGGSSIRRLALMPPAFVAAEWIRGTVWTGFPWLTVGTSQVPNGPLAGFAPLAGAYGTSFAVALASALLVALALRSLALRARISAAAALVAIIGVGTVASSVEWTRSDGEPLTVALLQGNVPQQIKWLEEVRTRTLLDYRQMMFDAKARVVVLPETALPAYLDQLPPDYMQSVREHARAAGKDIVMGTVERDLHGGTYDYFNSVVRLPEGGGPASYRKHHLVPFGEYIPPGFKFVLAVLHIPMSDFSRGPAVQAPLEAGGVRFGVAICYEDVYGGELLAFLPAAQALLNVSNDAWFGDSFAAEQHLQASQMRALETGRWMVRATNTGVTAAIDERGRVAARLATFTHGIATSTIVPRSGLTPYARTGDAAAIALAVAAIALGALLRGRR
jgi:apolipoprotein N-acyltransferase